MTSGWLFAAKEHTNLNAQKLAPALIVFAQSLVS